MATKTAGTNATTSLRAVAFSKGLTTLSDADIATMALAIKDDQNVAHPVWPGAFARAGLLYIPNRGVLTVLPGDYVMVDNTTGWPILVSARAIASGPWTHS